MRDNIVWAGRKQNHANSLGRKPYFTEGSLGWKQSRGQSRPEATLRGRLSLKKAKDRGQTLRKQI